jgi:hypothetical protein
MCCSFIFSFHLFVASLIFVRLADNKICFGILLVFTCSFYNSDYNLSLAYFQGSQDVLVYSVIPFDISNRL